METDVIKVYGYYGYDTDIDADNEMDENLTAAIAAAMEESVGEDRQTGSAT